MICRALLSSARPGCYPRSRLLDRPKTPAEFNHSVHHCISASGCSFLSDGFVADLLHLLTFYVRDALDSRGPRRVFVTRHSVDLEALGAGNDAVIIHGLPFFAGIIGSKYLGLRSHIPFTSVDAGIGVTLKGIKQRYAIPQP